MKERIEIRNIAADKSATQVLFMRNIPSTVELGISLVNSERWRLLGSSPSNPDWGLHRYWQ